MVKVTDENPKNAGFYMPAEWMKHDGCLMLWPFRKDNWKNDALCARKAFFNVACTISKYEKVFLGVRNSEYSEVKEMFADYNVEVFETFYDDAWSRDIAPTFVTNGKDIRGVCWEFDAWGSLYQNYQNDKVFAKTFCQKLNVDYYNVSPFIFEGGAVHVDGEGTAIVVESALGRNKNISKTLAEEYLKCYLNLEKIIWLPHGLKSDETGGHVDNILHYCSEATIVVAWTDDVCHPEFERCRQVFEVLNGCTDAKQRKFKIYKLHLPPTMKYTSSDIEGLVFSISHKDREIGGMLPATYTNFYLANDVVIMPTFNNEEYDKRAYDVLKTIFPNRAIEQIYSRDILLGGGNIHCITQQIPSVGKSYDIRK